jgi:hypothetical protein
MTNRVSSFPAHNDPAPLHRHGGLLDVTSELQVGYLADDYTVQGTGNIRSLPYFPPGVTFWLKMKGTPTFINSSKLICQNGGDYTAALGDYVIARSDGDGVWRLYVLPASRGILTATRLAKSAAYTVANGDIGASVALSGSTFYALTFGPATGYAAPWQIRVLNEDTGRAKLLLPTIDASTTSLAIATGSKAFTITAGLDICVGQRFRAWSASGNTNWMSGKVASYSSTTLTMTVDTVGGSGTKTDWQVAPEIYLWPKQSVVIENQNNVWKIFGLTPYMPDITGNLTLNVDPTNGSDGNDGLGTTTGAFKTLARAAEVAYRYVYQRDPIASVQIDGGGNTFQEFLQVFFPMNGGGTLIFQNLTWKPMANSYCLQFGDGALVGLANTTFSCSGVTTPGGYVIGHNHGVLDVNVGVTVNGGYTQLNCFTADFDTHFNINNGLTVGAGAYSCVYKSGQSSKWNINGTHTFTGSPTFSRFAVFQSGNDVTFGGGTSFSGTLTSSAMYVSGGSVVNNLSGSNNVPGGAPLVVGGGLYFDTGTSPAAPQ